MREVTYAELDKALMALGFTVRVVTVHNKLRLYEHEAGVRLALAYYPDASAVYPHHMAAVQGTLKVYGIADPIDFLVQLQTAG